MYHTWRKYWMAAIPHLCDKLLASFIEGPNPNLQARRKWNWIGSPSGHRQETHDFGAVGLGGGCWYVIRTAVRKHQTTWVSRWGLGVLKNRGDFFWKHWQWLEEIVKGVIFFFGIWEVLVQNKLMIWMFPKIVGKPPKWMVYNGKPY